MVDKIQVCVLLSTYKGDCPMTQSEIRHTQVIRGMMVDKLEYMTSGCVNINIYLYIVLYLSNGRCINKSNNIVHFFSSCLV